MYLWLNCEGWVSFGPFKWLKFANENRCIKDQDENVIATFDGEYWNLSDEKYKNDSGWHTPMITATPKHPHPFRA